MNASKTQATARSLHCLVACLVSLMVLASGCGRQSVKLISVEPQVLDSFAGSYEADVNTTITIERVEDHLTFAVDRQSSLAVFPVSENIFVHKESGTEITFVKNAAERVTHFLLSRDGQQKQAKRIAQINTNDQTQTVTISQSQVHLLTMGSGQPTVVLWGGSAGWRAVQSGVAKFA